MRGRLALVSEDSDGFVRNTVDGSDRNGSDSLAFRAILEGDATERLSLTAAFYGASVDGPAASYRRQGVMEEDGVTPCATADVRAGRCYDFSGFPTERDFYDVSENRRPTLDVDSSAGAPTVRWEGDAVTVQSVTGLQDLDKQHFEETDVNPIDFLNLDYGVDSRTFTEELHFSGGSDSLQWIVGAFYLDETLEQDQTADIGRYFRPLIESVDPVAYPGGFDPYGEAIDIPAMFARVKSTQDLQSAALFGQVNYSVTDALEAIVGLRYTYEEEDFRQAPVLVEPDFTVPLYDYDDSIDDSNVSGKLALEYSRSDDLLFYGSISTGFKAGGYNGGFLFDVSQQHPYDPETITTYELGVKSTWLGGTLRANAAAFFNAYDDMQLFRIEAGTGLIPQQILDNAGEAETWGLELELAAVPLEGLNVQLSLGLLETDLKNYVTDAGADLSGNDLAQSPKLSGFAYADYERPLGDALKLLSELSLSYQDDVFFTADNNPALQQDAYWLANALVHEMNKVRLPYNINMLSQAVARVVLEHDEELRANLKAIRRERDGLRAALVAYPEVEVFPTDANFFLIRTPHPSEAVHRGLAGLGVSVRRFGGPSALERCLRVTVGRPEENAGFPDALKRVLDAVRTAGGGR